MTIGIKNHCISTTEVVQLLFHTYRLKFPSIFIFYHCVSLLIYSSVNFISRVNKKDVICGSKNLLHNIADENIAPFFCRLVGM